MGQAHWADFLGNDNCTWTHNTSKPCTPSNMRHVSRIMAIAVARGMPALLPVTASSEPAVGTWYTRHETNQRRASNAARTACYSRHASTMLAVAPQVPPSY